MSVALIALYSWPIAAVALFQRYKYMVAICATIIGGYLLLPTNIGLDFPVLPKIDKALVPLLAVLMLVGSSVRAIPGAVLPGWMPKQLSFRLLLALMVLGVVGTVLTNGAPLRYGPRTLVGLSPVDLGSNISTLGVSILPLLVGWKYLGTNKGNETLLRVLIVAALCYSFLALFEVRMSPQLNRMVYGYFPHDWVQHRRSGGWRPIVFLEHGLVLGVFFSMATLGAAGLWRTAEPKNRGRAMGIMVYLLIVLVLCKVLASLSYALLLLPIALALQPRKQLFVASALAGIIVLYPMLRTADQVPTETLVSSFSSISPERADSLAYRFENEDQLLVKARERSIFGWGGWGRYRIYDYLGRDKTVVDGYWVIVFGEGGWVRYIAEFGILVLPILLLWNLARRGYNLSLYTSTLALMLTANLLDLLPNSGLTTLTYLINGALLGNVSHHLSGSASESVSAVKRASNSSASIYSRFRAQPRQLSKSDTDTTYDVNYPQTASMASYQRFDVSRSRKVTTAPTRGSP